MREPLLVAAVLLVVAFATWWAWRLQRGPRRCPHVSYQGRAGVACLDCRRDRRVADHLHRVTRSAR